MIKKIQLIFLLVTFFFQVNLLAQTERTKLSFLEQSSVKENTSAVNVNESFDTNISKQEFKKNVTQSISSIPDSLRNKLDGSKTSTNIKSVNKKVISDNVTYIKEDLPVSEINITSEKNTTKVAPSVNYKPKTIKEDIHPVADYSSVEISSSKRVFLQQEADDLIREIDFNKGNADYDLVAQKKKLDEILKMLKY